MILSTSSLLGLGCLLDSSGLSGGTGGSTTSTSPTGGGGATTTMGPGGSTSSMTSMGGGGAGGSTSMGGAGMGGTTSGGMGGVMSGSGGMGGVGGTMSSSSGSGGGPTFYKSCKEAKDLGMMLASGVIAIDPDGDGGNKEFDVYCDQVFEGGGWALLYNSVGKMDGKTIDFWDILYDDRFKTFGTPDLMENYYNGELYRRGTEYRDDIIDYLGVPYIAAVQVTVSGIDEATMEFKPPIMKVKGSQPLMDRHFLKYWSSSDHDGDKNMNDADNCALYKTGSKKGVSQHYNSCWFYNLGADADDSDPDAMAIDKTDGGWGPHVLKSLIGFDATFMAMQFEPNEGAFAGRVNRISRFARW